MGTSTWIAGLVPLLAFAIADMFLGFKKALIAAFVMAVLEAVWTQVTFGELDQITILSLVLIGLLGLWAWKKNSPLLFKLQPSFISVFLGGWLIISWLQKEALLVAMAQKYSHLLPSEVRTNLLHPGYLHLLDHTTLCVGIALLFHAGVTAWAAWRLGTWWWILVRGIGFYAFCFGAMLIAQLTLP